MTTEAASDAPAPPKPRGGHLSGSASLIFHRFVMQGTGLVLMLIAARFLTPAQFGLFALVVVTAQMLMQVAETGWFEYVNIWPQGSALPSEAFWCAAVSGMVFSCIGVAIAAGIFFVFAAPDYAWAMLILCSTILIAPVIAVQLGLLTREGRLGPIGVAMAVAEAIGLAVGVYGLYHGWGIYALAAQKVVCSGFSLIAALALGRWIPAIGIGMQRGAEAVRFAWSILLSRISAFVSIAGSDYIVGIFLTPNDVGLYRAANRLSGSLAELIAEPARMISWSILSKAAKPAEVPRRAPRELHLINATIFMIALPSFVGLALIAEPLIGILLGEAWQGAAIALALLCVARGLASCSQLVMPVLSLAGESRALPKLAALMTAINLGFIAAFAWKGLPWAAGAQIVASVVAMPLILRLLVRHGGIAWDETLKEMARTTACVAIMAAAVLGVGAASERYALLPWQSLAAMIAAGFIAYALALLLVRPLPVRAALQRLSA